MFVSLAKEVRERGPVIVERRSGKDRRQNHEKRPPARELRSGEDRRKAAP